MSSLHDDLWRQIEAFELDDPAAARPFSVRLAQDNNWSLRYAQRVIAEYKRYLFLAATSNSPMCPSEDVDQAWHLHLCFTRSYWQGLCEEVLGRPLHHEPSRGGAEQAAHHQAMYDKTLAAYRAAFGREPPPDVWPSTGDRFHASRRVTVDVSRHWIVPRPRVSRFVRQVRERLAGTLVLGVTAALPVVGVVANPLDLTGPEFLAFYVAVLLGAAAVGLVLRRALRTPDDATPLPALDAYETAVLAGGEDLAVRVALSELVVNGDVAVDSTNGLRVAAAKPASSERGSVPRAVYRGIIARVDATVAEACAGGKPEAAKIAGKLEGLGLLETNDSFTSARWAPTLIMLGVLLLGAAKIVVGASRGKPVTFLVLLCVGVGLIAWAFTRRPLRTPRGDRLLRQLRTQHGELKKAKHLVNQPIEHMTLGLALFGLAALSAAEGSAAELYRGLFPEKAAGGGSGCTHTSSCGGGGGGCGGGGCGGCGGD